MLDLWGHLQPKHPEESGEQDSNFCPSEDLWLKIAEAKAEKATGTLSFSQNIIEHFLETEDSANSE